MCCHRDSRSSRALLELDVHSQHVYWVYISHHLRGIISFVCTSSNVFVHCCFYLIIRNNSSTKLVSDNGQLSLIVLLICTSLLAMFLLLHSFTCYYDSIDPWSRFYFKFHKIDDYENNAIILLVKTENC